MTIEAGGRTWTVEEPTLGVVLAVEDAENRAVFLLRACVRELHQASDADIEALPISVAGPLMAEIGRHLEPVPD